jgi:peroxiredoxin
MRTGLAVLTLTGALLGAASAGATRGGVLEIGKSVPEFKAKDISGKEHEIAKYKGKWVVLEWTNHLCPAVAGYYKTNAMQELQKKYTEKGVIWLSVNSSAPGKEGNVSPAEAKTLLEEQKSAATALILDEPGTIGKAFEAKQTPTIYIVNPKGELAYWGAVDEAKPRGGAPEGWTAKNYVAAALDSGMAGKPIADTKTQPRG